MSLALYRKYRPGVFADVIGQEHVTGPLSRALDSDRIHHAYLFTGPRGCGKTSSARIMARAMNCEQGPTSRPCGTCQSCVELAPNGTGSIDVIEIDAATYRGIDDAKELRERAVYAPVASRYKIYIIDEAHQLTRDAFNVLLKLVEEPPPHLRFIFATTEPDKIIPTLRSRTHHYPFRLVSAKVLGDHLAKLCDAEGIKYEPAALTLIARAGQGSVRDSQSVLGQVIAGTGEAGITYADTVAQLGFTDETLLSNVVNAIASADGAALFTLIDQVVNTGHEPRRFAADLLERLRDLVIVSQVPAASTSGVFDIPGEQIDDLVAQAKLFSQSQLVRVADLVSAGLSELRGAASPRLQLELLAARLVTPQVHDDLDARVAKLEAGGVTPSVRPSLVREAAPSAPAAQNSSQNSAQPPAPRTPPTPPQRTSSTPPPMKPSQVTTATTEAAAPVQTETTPTPVSAASASIESIRENWPAVIEDVQRQSKVGGLIVRESVPLSLGKDGLLAVAFPNEGMMKNLTASGHDDRLRLAIKNVMNVDVRIDPIVDSSKTAAPKAKSKAAAKPVEEFDRGNASPDDEDVASRSAIDLIANALGGQVISESTHEL